MTRVCMYCKRDYGERCPVCGSEANPNPDGSYTCPNVSRCGVTFVKGAGGLTHGVCPECWKKRYPEKPNCVGGAHERLS